MKVTHHLAASISRVGVLAPLALVALAALACGCQHQPARSATHRHAPSHASHASPPNHLHGSMTAKKHHTSSSHTAQASSPNATAESTPLWAGELD